MPTAKRFRIKRMLWLLLIVIFLYYVALFIFQRALLFPGTHLSAEGLKIPTSVEVLTTAQQEHSSDQANAPSHGLYTHALFWSATQTQTSTASPTPSSSSSSPPSPATQPAPLVVFLHGNYELAEHYPWYADPYLSQGFNVLVVEYRGYGHSSGSPSQTSIEQDTLKLIQQACQKPSVDPTRLILHGRSLGGGVAVSVANRIINQHHVQALQTQALHPDLQIQALILESTFTSVAQMARRFAAPPFIVRDRFDTQRVLTRWTKQAQSKNPHTQTNLPAVLLLHGQQDDIVPIKHAKQNQKAFPQATLKTYPNMTHNDPWSWELIQDIHTFLDQQKLIPTSAPANPSDV